MSTELLDPPPVQGELQVDDQPKDPPKEQPKAKPVSLLDSLNIVRPEEPRPEVQAAEIKEPQKESDKKEEPKSEPVKEEEKEPPKEEPKPEPVKEPQMSETARSKFSALEKERDEFKRIAAEHKRKVEELTASTTDAEAFRKRAEEAEKRLQEMSRELRAASIERDPDFIRTYVDGRNKRLSEIKSLAVAAGATEDEFDRALRYGDEDALARWREELRPSQRAAWDGHQAAIADLEFRRKEAISDADRTHAELQSERQKQQAQQSQEVASRHFSMGREVVEDLFSKNDVIREDEDLRGMVMDTMEHVAGTKGEWGPKEIMQHVAAAVVQAKFLGIQAKAIEGQKSEIESITKERDELRVKLEEQEKRFKELSGGVPRTTTTQDAPRQDGKPKSLLDSVRIIAPV